MTKVRVLVVLAVVALLLFPAMAFAQGGLQLPCRFYGDVTIYGDPAPDDTVVSATIEGDEYTASTPSVYGAGTYALEITPPEGTNYSEGAAVSFKVGATQVATSTFEAGGNKELDLTIGTGPEEGGLITSVVVVTGSPADADYDAETGVLTLTIPAGATGPAGAAGPQGDQGIPGEDAPGGMALPIVALVLAVIAIGVAVMSMRRRV
ncbi:MAG TPA: hypothetical protein G4O13_02845 [Dehalococcoidia bacterium]|nr:hypothetical protein [Dehalococcoidia bacterium]